MIKKIIIDNRELISLIAVPIILFVEYTLKKVDIVFVAMTILCALVLKSKNWKRFYGICGFLLAIIVLVVNNSEIIAKKSENEPINSNLLQNNAKKIGLDDNYSSSDNNSINQEGGQKQKSTSRLPTSMQYENPENSGSKQILPKNPVVDQKEKRSLKHEEDTNPNKPPMTAYIQNGDGSKYNHFTSTTGLTINSNDLNSFYIYEQMIEKFKSENELTLKTNKIKNTINKEIQVIKNNMLDTKAKIKIQVYYYKEEQILYVIDLIDVISDKNLKYFDNNKEKFQEKLNDKANCTEIMSKIDEFGIEVDQIYKKGAKHDIYAIYFELSELIYNRDFENIEKFDDVRENKVVEFIAKRDHDNLKGITLIFT